MQEITTREKLFALLGFFILLMSLPLALIVVKQRVTYRGRAVGVASVPKQVMVTNVHAKGFTVSWLTDNQTNGSVLNGSTEVQDVRGAADTYYTHYVDVLNLNPETDYSIKIKSGPDTYSYASISGWTKDIGMPGQGLTVRTAKQIGDETQPPSVTNPYGAYSTEQGAFGPCPDGTLNPDGTPHTNQACFRPYPLWGEVKNSSGQAVAGALVYAAIREAPDSKYAISAISGSDGKWSLELANQYTNNFQSYLAYNPLADKINVAAYSNQGAGVANNLGMVSVLSTECPDLATNCPMNAPSPVILTLSGGATPPPTTPVVTNPPVGGISFQINKVQLQGRSDHMMTYVVKFRQAGSANTSAVLGTANVTTNPTGVGNGSVNIAAGNYDVYIAPSETYLSAKLSNVAMQTGQATTLDFTNGAVISGGELCANANGEVGRALCAGDIKGLQGSADDEVGAFDFNNVMSNFDKQTSSLSDVLKQADQDKSGTVGIFDFNRAMNNFGKKGADRP